MPRFEYSAFISYAHKDKLWAKWLKCKLESSRFPVSPDHPHYKRTYEGAAPDLEELPCRHPRHALRDVFLDERNAGNGELTEVLKSNIRKSKYLIVICSPAAVRSTWVPREIAYFKEVNPDTYRQRIIPLIVEGRIDEQRGINECFPAGLDPSTLGSVVKGRNALHVGGERRAVRFIDNATRLSIALAGKDLALSRIAASLLGIDNPDHLYKSRRRAVRRRRMLLSVLLATALALCIGYYFRFEHTYTRYYANYVERNGIPVGIHPLRRGELPLQYQYYEFKVRNRRVRELRCKDSWGDLAEPLQPGIWRIAPWLTYEYTPQGLVSRIVCRDDKGHEGVITFPGTSRDNLQLLAPSGESIYLINDRDGDKTGTRLHYIRTRRNERGEIVRMVFHTNTDPESRGETAEGIGGTVFTRDSAGLVRSTSVINSAENPVSFWKGVSSERYDYDEYGRCIGHAVFSEDGSPAYNNEYSHAYRFSGLGTDSITITNLGPDGSPCLNKDCFAFVSQVTRGDTMTFYYLDRRRQPVFTKSLMAESRLIRNPETGDRRQLFFDTEGRPTLCRQGYAAKTITTRGDTLLIAYYDTEMRPCMGHESESGFSCQKEIAIGDRAKRYEVYDALGERIIGPWGSPVMELYLNERSREDSCAYFDEPGVPTRLQQTAFEKNLYDSFGNITETRRYDRNGKLISRLLQQYDPQGNRTSQRAVDADGDPLLIRYEEKYGFVDFAPDDIMGIHWQYEDSGRKTAAKFILWPGSDTLHYLYDYDRFRNVVGITYEDCRIRMKYDSIGKNMTEMSIFDEHLHPKEQGGIHRIEWVYDRRDNPVSIKIFDRHNRLTSSKDPDGPQDLKSGAGFVHFRYDERDNVIEKRLFDTRLRPIATPESGSVVTYRYDETDRVTEIAHYHRGKPYTTKDAHKQRIEYRSTTECTVKYLNEKDEPMNSSKGFSEIRFEGVRVSPYDKAGRCLGFGYYRDPSEQEHPIEIDGFHRCKITYNADHTRKEESYYDIYGRRCTNRKLGASRISTDFTASGKELRVVIRDSLDDKADCSNGYAEVRRTYDKLGREIKMAFYHADGTPAEDVTADSPYKGISYFTREHFRSDGMNLQKVRTYDKEDLLQNIFILDSIGRLRHDGKYAASKIKCSYNTKGWLESVEYYDWQNILLEIRRFEYHDDHIQVAIRPAGNLILQKTGNRIFEAYDPDTEKQLRITKQRQNSYLMELSNYDDNLLLYKWYVDAEHIFVYLGLKEEMFD